MRLLKSLNSKQNHLHKTNFLQIHLSKLNHTTDRRKKLFMIFKPLFSCRLKIRKICALQVSLIFAIKEFEVRFWHVFACCFSCPGGLYGPLCRQKCSENCISFTDLEDTCDFYGNCFFGCEETYFGDKCDTHVCPFENCLKCSKSIFGFLECTDCGSGIFVLSFWYLLNWLFKKDTKEELIFVVDFFLTIIYHYGLIFFGNCNGLSL